jgi:hypothetical protein
VESTPLLGAEVQRIRAAFQAASLELSAALEGMSEADLTGFGTPTSDPAVVAAMADLRTSIERVRSTADDCVAVTGRHLVPRGDGPGSTGDGPGAAPGGGAGRTSAGEV